MMSLENDQWKCKIWNQYLFLSYFSHCHMKGFSSKHIALKTDVTGAESILFQCRRVSTSFTGRGNEGVNITLRGVGGVGGVLQRAYESPCLLFMGYHYECKLYTLILYEHCLVQRFISRWALSALQWQLYRAVLCFRGDPLRSSRMQHWMSDYYSFTQRVLEYPLKCRTYSAVCLLHSWCHVQLLPSRIIMYHL